MAKGDKKIEFTKNYSLHKKGAKGVFSRDLANMLIGLKVAKEVKPQTKVKGKK